MADQCENKCSTQDWVEMTWQELSPQIYKLCEIKCKSVDDAKDLFQEIALKFCINAQKLRKREYIFPWLMRVMRTSRYDMMSKRHLTCAASNLRDRHLSYEKLSESRSVFAQEKESFVLNVDAILNGLTPVERLIVKLAYVGHSTSYEISGILGISPNAVRKRLHSAMKKLREEIKKDDIL